MSKDILSAKADFPLLKQTINDHPLVYLDNAATTQKPQVVIDALVDYYTRLNANIHRGNHSLAVQATEAYERARRKVASYINAEHDYEVIFTRGTTESINLLAYTYGEKFVQPGDEVIITQLEHHSNFVPWQQMCLRRNAILRVLPFNEHGELDLALFERLLNEKTRLVAINHISNSLGTVNPVEEIIRLAHAHEVPVLVDAAQSVQHIGHDVQSMDADFYVFSGHKMYGPMGIGIFYGKEKWLDALPPFLSGGEMIESVTPEKVTFNVLPYKFEAGTPSVAQAIGLGVAIDYLQQFDPLELRRYEVDLLAYGLKLLAEIPDLVIYGDPAHRSGILPFNVDGIQHYDMGVLLDTMGIAVRTGQHCTQPVMDALHISGTVRASLALYNNLEDLEKLVSGVRRAIKMLKR